MKNKKRNQAPKFIETIRIRIEDESVLRLCALRVGARRRTMDRRGMEGSEPAGRAVRDVSCCDPLASPRGDGGACCGHVTARMVVLLWRVV